MRICFALLFFFALFSLSGGVRAETIVPVPALTLDHTRILGGHGSQSEGTVAGRGTHVKIRYASASALEGFVSPFIEEGLYNPAEMFHFRLAPSSQLREVFIDLTGMPTWSPGQQNYYIVFLAEGEAEDAALERIELVTRDVSVLSAATRHLFTSEPFLVGSAHFLRGYRMLGLPLPVLFGSFVLLCALIVLGLKRATAIPLALHILLGGFLLYQARFSVDLLRYSFVHAQEWMSQGTYGEAGSSYEIASVLRAQKAERIFVCHDMTDYYAKVLRYAAYPIPVSLPEPGEGITHVVVHRKIEWSFDGQTLRCGSIERKAQQLQEFPDGSLLFALLP